MGDEDAITRHLERQPVVIVSAFEGWYRKALVALLLIDLVFTGVLLKFVDKNYGAVKAVEEMIDQAKALDCRGLVLSGVKLDADGACYDPEVLRYYDPETGESR